MGRRQLFELSRRQKRRIIKNSVEFETSNNKSISFNIKNDNESIPPTFSANLLSAQDLDDSISELVEVNTETLYDGGSTEHPNVIEFEENCQQINIDGIFNSDGINFHTENFENPKNNNLRADLQRWGVNHQVTHSAISDLLKILRKHNCLEDLPLQAKTLLKTPKETIVRSVIPGQYCHLGIENGIKKIFEKSHQPISEVVKVHFNIDGIPLHKSTNKQLWPILGSVKKFPGVFVAGIYEGNSKPSDVNDFLQDFVNEAVHLYNNDILFNHNFIKFEIEAFICDAPARAFATSIKNHTGYYGCGKCIVKGKYVENRVVMLKTDATLRTDDTFRQRTQEKHHNGASDLEKLPINMVECFPYEYMHLICLGVTKKLIKQWTSGKVQVFRLGPKIVEKISKKLVKLGKDLPCEFNRKQRPLSELDRWKATELRTFLLYTGPVALRKYLPEKHYQLFLCLCFSIRILATPNQPEHNISYAESLLHYFVGQFKILYGRVNVSYNIHGLIHLAADVRRLGPLDTFSAFKYENKLGEIKKLIRKSSCTLPQVHRRLLEKDSVDHESSALLNFPSLSNPQSDGTYKVLKFADFALKSEIKNGTFLLKSGEVAVVESFPESVNGNIVVCRKFGGSNIGFTYPCDSSIIAVTEVDPEYLSGPSCVPITEIKQKCVILRETNSKYFVFPLLHCN